MFIYVSFVHKFCKQCLFPVPLPLLLWALFVCLTQLSILVSCSLFLLCKLINVAKTSHFTENEEDSFLLLMLLCKQLEPLCWLDFLFLFSGISLNIRCLSQDSCLLLESLQENMKLAFPSSDVLTFFTEFSFAENYNCSHYFVTFELLSAKSVIIKMIFSYQARSLHKKRNNIIIFKKEAHILK